MIHQHTHIQIHSLLCGSPQFILDKLQRVQNSAARLVMKSCKCGHVQPLLRSLHWLPFHSRIDYKISTLSPTLLLSISLSFYPSTPLPDTSVHPRTHAPCVLSSKLSHLVKEHSPSQAQLNGIYCLMDSDTLNLLHLKQLSKPISSDLRTNLLYPLDAL